MNEEREMRVWTLMLFLALGTQLLGAKTYAEEKKEETNEGVGTYKIYQSKVSKKHVFKLNTRTGVIQQLQLNQNKKIVWRKMKIENALKIKSPKEMRFEIHISPLTKSHVILLDNMTGQTWRLRRDSKGVQFWIDFAE